MHDTCMATKTITLELDAYDKLRRAKRSSRESFSSVVRRATWPSEPLTGAALASLMTERMQTRRGVVEETILNQLDAAQSHPRVSASKH